MCKVPQKQEVSTSVRLEGSLGIVYQLLSTVTKWTVRTKWEWNKSLKLNLDLDYQLHEADKKSVLNIV